MGHYKSILSVLTSSLVLVGHAVADDISVSEFESGTTISSDTMNDNFETVVDELNSQDSRIELLETRREEVPIMVWVDGNNNLLGFPSGNPTAREITVPLPETDLVMAASYWITGGGQTRYRGSRVLRYSGQRCTGVAVLEGAVRNGLYEVSFGVTEDGKYAYPAGTGIGEFAALSAVEIDQYTGEISCVNDSRTISPWSVPAISEKDYLTPLPEPTVLRYR